MADASLLPVEFAGATLYVINREGQPFVPMKPIVESMGMDWASQFTKLKANAARWGVVEIAIPSNGGPQAMVSIPLHKVAGWINSISANKVKPELRERVLRYQNECDSVLWDYWSQKTVGQAMTASTAPYSVAPRQSLTAEEADMLRNMISGHAATLPKSQQAEFTIKAWSKLKAHFGCAYRDIPSVQFADALGIVGRHIVAYTPTKEPEPVQRHVAIPLEQVEAIKTRIDRVAGLFHPFSSQFADCMGVIRALRGLDPKLGCRRNDFIAITHSPN